MGKVIRDHLAFKGALIDEQEYRTQYQRSIDQPEAFWAEQAQHYLHWHRQWDDVLTGDFSHHNVRWFVGGRLNACYNCLDRHLPERALQPAIIWEGDEPSQSEIITYEQLHEQVCRLANVLKNLGVKKGDCVCIYLPMIKEAAISMLACARIGAIHTVVFAGFSPQALKNRIIDANCCLVITADENIRGGVRIPLKTNVNDIIDDCPSVKHVLLVKNTGAKIPRKKQDIEYQEAMSEVDSDCPVVEMAATDPLFILYTSGSTGKPKGILHGTGGYLVHVTMSFKLVFNYLESDIYWCSADVGWITGHSYLVYGPLANGATTLMFAGTPTYPTPERFWQVIDKHRVNIFYTAPTAIRSLMRFGDDHLKRTNRDSLKLLGTVGEPINPDVWQWYYDVVGKKRCPIVDTWWQTETGGIMLTPLPGATPLKPGAASWPFFGVAPAIANNGNLVITQPWPGQLQTIYGDQKRFVETYFSQYPGQYFTGDGAHCDADGFYWISGRVDDVINVSGHRFDTAEIESALVKHPSVAEAAVVGYPHKIKGQGIFAFVTPKADVNPDQTLYQALIKQVRHEIGPIATPDKIEWAADLPKTRSGKIMRRILRKIVSHDLDNLGDISTLANPGVVETLINQINGK